MMFNAPSFFAGVAAVLGILIFGFGGGVLMSSILLDNGPREPNKIERRAAEEVKPPALETKPAAVVAPAAQPAPPAAPAAQPAPQPAPAAQPAPAPQVQQATSQPQPPTPSAEPQPAPQVRRVDLPPASQTQATKPPEPQQPNAPSRMTVRQVPLGPEQPVALPNPAHDPSAAEREARRKAQEAKKLERKRKQEERKLAEQRRQQSIREAQELKATAERSRRQEVDDDDDDRDERPALFRRERERPFGRPFFRMFGGDDD